MPTLTKETLCTWLRQHGRKPRFLLVGPDSALAVKVIVGELAGTVSEIKEQSGNVWNEIARQLKLADRVIVVPGGRGSLPQDLVNVYSLDVVRVLASASTEDETRSALYEIVSNVVAGWPPPAAQKAASDKDNTSTVGHYKPKSSESIVTEICKLPAVSRVRHKKGAGRDYYASVVGDQISVHVEQTYGLLIDTTSTHPAHLEAVRDEVTRIIERLR